MCNCRPIMFACKEIELVKAEIKKALNAFIFIANTMQLQFIRDQTLAHLTKDLSEQKLLILPNDNSTQAINKKK